MVSSSAPLIHSPIGSSSGILLPDSSGGKNNGSHKIRTWMNQSTIYRRHEERRARTYRLRDDPRPPFLRVLSLLPGLQLIVPRYKTNNPDDPTWSAAAAPSKPLDGGLGDYPEDTTFFIKGANKESSSSSFLWTTSNPQIVRAAAAAPTAWQTALQAMLATCGTAAIANHLWGGIGLSGAAMTPAGRSTIGSTSSTANPFLRENYYHFTAARPISLHHPRKYQPAACAPKSSASLFWAVIFSSPTAILFGAKVYLDDLLEMEGGEAANPIVASAGAGLVACLASRGIAALVSASTTSSIPLARHVSHQMLGATVYFGTYDWLLGSFGQQPPRLVPIDGSTTTPAPTAAATATPPHLPSVAAAGAVAGSVSSVVLLVLGVHGKNTLAAGTMTAAAASAPSHCIRVAPFHAFVFCAYESMRFHCRCR